MRESPGRQAARGRWVIEGGKAGRLCSRNGALAYIFLYILLAATYTGGPLISGCGRVL